MRAADPVTVNVFSARAVNSSSRLPPTRDAARTDSPGCRTSRLRRHAAIAGPPAECCRSWHTGSLALSTRHSSLLHARPHDHSHSWDRPQPLRLPGLSAPNQPLVGPETPSRRHTLQWPLLLMPGVTLGFGGERHDGRTITWPRPCRMSWQGAIASTRRVPVERARGQVFSTRHARHRNPAGGL